MLFKTVLFLTLLSIFATVLCDDKEVCDFTDEVCVTNAEKPVIKSIIAGNELWELESSDPLHVEKININLSHNMAYIFTDVYLYGMTDCDVRTLRFNNDFSWYFYMIFPQLILKADYIEKGSIDSVPIESQGKIIITYDIYHIVTKGQVETITGSGGKPHINITQYKIDELDVKNGVNFEFINVRTDVLEKCVDKELCNFTDEVCVTNAEKSVIKSIIAGNELWELESSDPLRVEKINVNLSHNMNYIFTDVYLYGMTDFDVRTLRFDKDLSFYFYLIFPQLVLKADYIEKGLVDSVPIEGKGKIIITYDTYHIVTKGGIETITGHDGKPHINVTDYKIDELDVKNDVTFEFINVYTTDLEKTEKAHKYFNDNWKKVNDEIQYQILQPLMDLFFRNINQYLVAVPKYEIFYKNP